MSIKNAQSAETRYLWCGDRICQSRNASDGIMTRYFVEGVVAPGSPGLVYGVDQLGTVRDQTPLQGSGAAAFDYDPYGKLTRQTGNPASEMSYAGLFYDANSGLYLANYRAYDPQSARWISRDPIREHGGLNLYSYVGGNPISYVDPEGKALTLPGVIVVAGITYGGYKLYTKFEKFNQEVEACKLQCESTVACGNPERTGMYQENAARCIATCKANATIGSFFGIGKGPTGPKSPETTPGYFKGLPPADGRP